MHSRTMRGARTNTWHHVVLPAAGRPTRVCSPAPLFRPTAPKKPARATPRTTHHAPRRASCWHSPRPIADATARTGRASRQELRQEHRKAPRQERQAPKSIAPRAPEGTAPRATSTGRPRQGHRKHRCRAPEASRQEHRKHRVKSDKHRKHRAKGTGKHRAKSTGRHRAESTVDGVTRTKPPVRHGPDAPDRHSG